MAKDVSFPSIDPEAGNTNPYLKNADLSSQVDPQRINTGNIQGEQVIKGAIRVVDDKGVTRMIMGFKPGAF